ncbi:MAG: beta-lactamase family protein, partial [Sediminibacterium sp.]|nr:beta-lactamase family protein [Sediminibacterium sp.]
MNSKVTIIYLTFYFLLVGVANGQQPSHTQLKKDIKSLLDKWNSEKDMGIAVLVGHQGKIIYHNTVGLRNRARNEKIKKTDLFEYASVSKQFTASVILMLEQEGKLTVDDSVHWYIQSPYKNITIRHLLQHTSGLPDYQQVMSMFWDKSKIANNNDILEYLNKYQPPILFQPGATYEYSNTGYIFLASIAEKASGKDFTILLDSGIFIPSKMKTAALRTPAERSSISNFTKGYVWNQPEKKYQLADSMIQFNYTI